MVQNETFRIRLISTVAYNPNTVNSSHTTIHVKNIRMQSHLQVITQYAITIDNEKIQWSSYL